MSTPEPDRDGRDSASDATTAQAATQTPFSFLQPAVEPGEIGRLGNYRVLRLIGTGGMGFVFEAEEPSLHRRVALKVLKRDRDNEGENRKRFLREARAAAAIHSDHVVTIYQIIEDDPPYIVMPLLVGESLQQRIERSEPISLRLALEIAKQTADGLAAAHDLGMTHRDIKPANLWLEYKTGSETDRVKESATADGVQPRKGPVCRVKILDFGLARRTTGEVSLTSTGFIVGTPCFMAPEQASGTNIDPRSDLFSLGSVLYTVLTGEMPFPGNSAMAVMMSLASTTPPPVHQRVPTVPKEVSDFVGRLLEKSPDRRPQGAREIVTEVDRLITLFARDSAPDLQLPTNSHAAAESTPGEIETLEAPRSKRLEHAVHVQTAKRRPILLSPWVWLTLGGVGAVAAVLVFLGTRPRSAEPDKNPLILADVNVEPIIVGVLHSKTGKMAPFEQPVLRTTQLAIAELNAAGGLLGRPVKAVVEDGNTYPEGFAQGAEKLLVVDKAVAIFGCWTSTSRRTVRPLFESHNGLLFFPALTEGLELSPRIVYLGPTANQYLTPAVDYFVDHLHKKRFFVAGTDSVMPRAVALIVREHLRRKGGDAGVVDEAYLHIRSNDTTELMNKLLKAKPDVVINAIYGTASIDLFNALREARMTPDQVPTLSLNITQNEVKGLNPEGLAGSYLAASYFQSVPGQVNAEFVEKMKRKHGPDTTVTDPMCAAYAAVNLWAQAVRKARSPQPEAVLRAVRGLGFEGPRGQNHIDPDNLYTWLPARLARIRPDGELDLITAEGLNTTIAPIPYPATRKKDEWNGFIKGLSLGWNDQWYAPPHWKPGLGEP